MPDATPPAGRDSRVEAAAALLIEARGTRRPIAMAPFGLRDVDEAYAIQDLVAARMGGVAAWKVGAKGLAAVPTCAPILAGLLVPSPACLPARHFHMIGIEAELAFRLGRDVPAGEGDLDDEAIHAAIATIHPAIEVVDTRIVNWRQADKLWLLADNQMNGGLVYGAGTAAPRDLDLTQQPVHLLRDGAAIAQSVGGNPAGDPWRVLAWLVNHCRHRRGGLPAGTVVTTGSCTGMIFVEPGARLQAVFPGIGAVGVELPV